jgi:hypothetical protein
MCRPCDAPGQLGGGRGSARRAGTTQKPPNSGDCEGWTAMLCAMKVWLEHGIKGINLPDRFYK